MQGSDQRREIRGPGKINLVFCPRRQSLVARSRNGYSIRVVVQDTRARRGCNGGQCGMHIRVRPACGDPCLGKPLNWG